MIVIDVGTLCASRVPYEVPPTDGASVFLPLQEQINECADLNGTAVAVRVDPPLALAAYSLINDVVLFILKRWKPPRTLGALQLAPFVCVLTE